MMGFMYLVINCDGPLSPRAYKLCMYECLYARALPTAWKFLANIMNAKHLVGLNIDSF